MQAIPAVHCNLTIRQIRSRTVKVPRPRALAAQGTSKVSSLVLVDLETAEGITGSSYVYCTLPLSQEPLAELIAGLQEPLVGKSADPVSLNENLRRVFHLLGVQGLTAMAVSALDVAAWDARAKAAGLPLVRLIGGEPRPLAAYATFGMGMIGPEAAARGTDALLSLGFRAIKVRLGYPDVKSDVAVVRAVRQQSGPDIELMADYNQSLTVVEAIRRGQELDGEKLAWIEEPTLASDYEGHASIARELRTPVQIGENWWTTKEMAKAVAARAADLVMPDASRVGGVSGWMRAAAIAEAHGLPISSHLMPELSVHLMSVASTRHWVEYVDWLKPILKTPLEVNSGQVLAYEGPGIGLEWDEEAIAQYLVA